MVKFSDELIKILSETDDRIHLVVTGDTTCGILEKAIESVGIKIVNSLATMPIAFVKVDKNEFEKLVKLPEVTKIRVDEIQRCIQEKRPSTNS